MGRLVMDRVAAYAAIFLDQRLVSGLIEAICFTKSFLKCLDTSLYYEIALQTKE